MSELADEVAAEMQRGGARESPSVTTELLSFFIVALCVVVFCRRRLYTRHSRAGGNGKLSVKQFAQAAEFAGEAGVVFQFAAPHAHDPPAAAPQFAVDFFGAFNIAKYFRFPILPPRLRNPAVPRAVMPKAAVNKNGNAPAPKDKIRLAENRLPAPPSGNPFRPQNTRKRNFRFFVAG